jgi:hypothetical protein
MKKIGRRRLKGKETEGRGIRKGRMRDNDRRKRKQRKKNGKEG